MGLEIKRQLPVMPDRQQMEISVSACAPLDQARALAGQTGSRDNSVMGLEIQRAAKLMQPDENLHPRQ